MPLYQKIALNWRPVAVPDLMVGGIWRKVVSGYIKVAGVWRQFYGALSSSVSGDPATVTGIAGPQVTNAVTVTPIQGTPGYTYAWQYVSGDYGPFPTNPTSNVTAWGLTSGPGTTYNSVWRCMITDAAGVVAYSANVAVSMTFS